MLCEAVKVTEKMLSMHINSNILSLYNYIPESLEELSTCGWTSESPSSCGCGPAETTANSVMQDLISYNIVTIISFSIIILVKYNI